MRETETVNRRYDATLYEVSPPGIRTTWRRSVVRRVLRVIRQVAGAPDYAAYLAHCRRAGHEPRLGENQYLKEFFETKGKTARCC